MLSINMYDIVNSEHQAIGYITAPSIEIASKKLKLRYPNGWPFLKLIKTGGSIYIAEKAGLEVGR